MLLIRGIFCITFPFIGFLVKVGFRGWVFAVMREDCGDRSHDVNLQVAGRAGRRAAVLWSYEEPCPSLDR